MRRFISPRYTGAALIVVMALVLMGTLLVAGCACTPVDQAIEEPGGIESTGTVQAELPTTTAEPTSSVTPTSAVEPTPTVWPAKVGAFAKSYKKQAWYPTYVPKGYKIDSLDIVELDKGTGLVCDIVYLNGDNMVDFMQGSPKGRNTEIASVEKVAWGTEKADLTYQIEGDPESLPMIVYYKGGTLIELTAQGLSLPEMKKMAASMVPVK